jgi:hypothetical protein
MAGSIFWGMVPFGVAALRRQRDFSNANTKLSLGAVGAAFGTAAFIWLGYIVRQAGVQTEKGGFNAKR